MENITEKFDITFFPAQGGGRVTVHNRRNLTAIIIAVAAVLHSVARFIHEFVAANPRHHRA